MLGVQDYIAFIIVGAVVFYWLRKIFWPAISRILSRVLLKYGKVKWAMRLHRFPGRS